MPITKSTKAPRGTNIVVAGFMEALSGIPASSVQDVGKAALAKIRDQMKEMKAAAKQSRSAVAPASRATKAPARATVSRKTKAASTTRKVGAKRSYTRRAAIGSITPTSDASTDSLVN